MPFVTPKNQKKRLEFVRDHIATDAKFWDSILWSDESKFNIFGSDGRTRVFRTTGEALELKKLLPTVKWWWQHHGVGLL